MFKITKSQELNARLQEIQSCAAMLPSGGDVKKLQAELVRLNAWVSRTIQFIGQIEDQSSGCNFGECSCRKTEA